MNAEFTKIEITELNGTHAIELTVGGENISVDFKLPMPADEAHMVFQLFADHLRTKYPIGKP